MASASQASEATISRASKGRRFLRGTLVGGLLVVLPFAAFIAVMSVSAPGEGTQFDVLKPALHAFAVWWLPILVLIGFRLLSTSNRWILLAVSMAGLVCAGYTIWLVRPQAPDGAGRESLQSAEHQLTADIDTAFRNADIGGWTVHPEQWGPHPCSDVFGRDRGAAKAWLSITHPEGFSLDHLRRLQTALSDEGWLVTIREWPDASQGALLQAERNGYVLTANGGYEPSYLAQPTIAEASTPCLHA